MLVTLVMSSGKELDFECDDITVSKDRVNNQLTGLTLKGAKGRTFMYMKLQNVDAILIPAREENP